MSKRFWNVMFAGEAGQGLQTVGEIFARAVVRSGYRICVTQTYESRVRGGHNTFAVRISPQEVNCPQEAVDLLVALNAESIGMHRGEMTDSGKMIADEALSLPGERALLEVPFKKLAGDGFANTAAMGVAASILGLREEVVAAAMADLMGKAHPEQAQKNRMALSAAYEWAAEKALDFPKPQRIAGQARRLVMNGHEAVALGAISAGVKFCAFYPMSPSTSVAMTMIQWAKEMGLVVEQAEDEIAAINMALGASYAGAPSLVPTSGGGFALMVEGVSLAAVSETPVVVVIGQRPGPATGLATRTEQADLEFVLHSGHGEFPKAIFAPGDMEECFHLTRKAVEVAERFQGPTFVLTDHFLADSYRDVEPFDVVGLSFVKPGVDPAAVDPPYRRYAITPDGVSPRLLPGLSTHLVVADSHEHTETGHLTEDLTLRPKMVQKRLRKGQGIREEVIPPRYNGPAGPRVLLVSWGSTKGAADEAADRLRGGGTEAATLHFSQVWPLVAEQFLRYLEETDRVVCVEGNATGQLARLIHRETGFRIHGRISRFDGLPITPEYILRALDGQVEWTLG